MKFCHIILAFLLFSCSAKKDSNLTSTKDSVLEAFLQYSSKSQFYDTTNYNYKILKAHFYDDTLFLQQVVVDIEKSKEGNGFGFPDSTRRHPDISKLQIDEAYQLSYSEIFCDKVIYLTIIKKGDSISLHSVIYQENKEPSFLKVFKDEQRKLSLDNWNEFESLINYADFWTLSQYKESTGFDGDYLTTEGILRNRFDHKITKQHKVDRRFASNTALYTAYLLLAKFANLKKDCDNRF